MPGKFIVTIKVTFDDRDMDYAQVLAYKQRLAELALDLAPGKGGTVGASIEDWAQVISRDTRLKYEIEAFVRTSPPRALAARIMLKLKELGYVSQA